MKLYISGPISGVPDYRERFQEAELACAGDGHHVMNPAVLPNGFGYSDYMRICIPMLDACEAIVMLDGWRDSKGALAELSYAQATGKAIFYGPESVIALGEF